MTEAIRLADLEFVPKNKSWIPTHSLFRLVTEKFRLLQISLKLVSAVCNFKRGNDGIQGDETTTAGSDLVESGRPIFDDFFQHLLPYIGNNTENVVFQMVQRLWLIRIDQ
ncbi:hypothetical protein TNCV_2113731 [Trichonephila clavipes]|nr:hypothetical protein TNCV_2113731 [Trichonephila clavipes]